MGITHVHSHWWPNRPSKPLIIAEETEKLTPCRSCVPLLRLYLNPFFGLSLLSGKIGWARRCVGSALEAGVSFPEGHKSEFIH